jgi:hypothetical protein
MAVGVMSVCETLSGALGKSDGVLTIFDQVEGVHW